MSAAQTEATLLHHLTAFGGGDVDEILADYTEESVVITHDGALRGLADIRPFFENFVKILPPGSDFQMIKQVTEGELAYIFWKAESDHVSIPLGTDTFIIRDSKIVLQTFAGTIETKG